MATIKNPELVFAVVPRVAAAFSLIGSSFIVAEVCRDRRKRSRVVGCVENSIANYHLCADASCLPLSYFVLKLKVSPNCGWHVAVRYHWIDLLLPGAVAVAARRGVLAGGCGEPADGECRQCCTSCAHLMHHPLTLQLLQLQQCTAQAFFGQAVVATVTYNTILAIQYLMIISFRISEKQIERKYEKFMHAIPILVWLTTGVLGIAFEVFNPAFFNCWIAPVPINCAAAGEIPDGRPECPGDISPPFFSGQSSMPPSGQ